MKKFLKDKRGISSIQLILVIAVLLGLLVFFIGPKIIESIQGTKDSAVNGLNSSYTDTGKDNLFVGNDTDPGSTDYRAPQLYSSLIIQTVKVTDNGSTVRKDLVDAHLSATFQDISGIDYIEMYKDGVLKETFPRQSTIDKYKFTEEGNYSLKVADRLYALRDENPLYNTNMKEYFAPINKERIPIDVRISKTVNGKHYFTIERIGDKTALTKLEVLYNNGAVETKTLNNLENTEYILDVLRNGTYTLKVTDTDGNVFIYEYNETGFTPELSLLNSFIYGKVTVKPSNIKQSDILTAKWALGNKTLAQMKSSGTVMNYNNGYSNTTYVKSGEVFTMYFQTKYHDILYVVTTTYKDIYTPGLNEEPVDGERAVTTITKTITNR